MVLVQELCSRNRQTVLLVTHDPEEAYCLADWVYVVEGPPLSVAKQLDMAEFRKKWANGDESAGLQRFRALLTQPGADHQH
ncbi:hypothetical protein D3C75_1222080 [compost metagenome]